MWKVILDLGKHKQLEVDTGVAKFRLKTQNTVLRDLVLFGSKAWFLLFSFPPEGTLDLVGDQRQVQS